MNPDGLVFRCGMPVPRGQSGELEARILTAADPDHVLLEDANGRWRLMARHWTFSPSNGNAATLNDSGESA